MSASDRTVVVEHGRARQSVTVLGPRVVRLGWSATGARPPRRPWAVTRPDEAYPVIRLDLERADGESGDTVIRSADLEVRLTADGGLQVAASGGPEIVKSVEPPSFAAEANVTRWPLRMPPDRRYYGFGERTGLLEKRGRRYSAWTTDEWRHQGPTTDSLYVAVPFHLGVDPDGTAHGVFIDTTRRSWFDLTGIDRERLVLEAAADTLDWYLFLGPSPEDVVGQLTELVGRAALPPRWAFGYHQARWSYGSADEVRSTARSLRAHLIPADVVHVDIHHLDRFRPFTWDRERFPDPAGMVADVEQLGLRTTVVVDAALPVGDDYEPFEEARRQDFLIRQSAEPGAPIVTGYVWGGCSAYPDQLRADVREWWGALHRPYVDIGVAGFVNDMNEPSMRDAPIDQPATANAEPPPDAPMGDPALGATHAEVRNLYAQSMNQATSTFLRAARPDVRPFVLSRSGFAGVQRDALSWTGDNWSTWEHLEMSMPQLMNMGLSGIPFTGADIGGFFEGCTPELLVRWTQLGALYPFARNNSADGTPRQEPWAWGEPTLGRCRRAIELRYRLLPYLYTTAEAATRSGVPWFRPLLLSYPDDAEAQVIDDQAMIGPDLMVAPVVRPGRTSRGVYVPRGRWFDARTGQAIDGPIMFVASATLDEDIPLFVRAGAIIPMSPVTQSTRERAGRLEVHVWPAPDGAAGTLYEDDGETTRYLEGDLARTRFEARPSVRGWQVRARREGAYDPGPRAVSVVLHDAGGGQQARGRSAVVEDGPSWEVDLRA